MTTVKGMPVSRSNAGRYRVFAVLLLAVLVIGFWFLKHRAPPASPAAVVEAPLELSQADVAMVALKPLARRLPLSGSVEPVNQAAVKSKVSGDVLEMTVREGQTVRRGDMLARIDIRNAGATRDNAQATLEKARADLAIAKLNYENSAKLLDQKFISQNAVDSSKATYDAAVANAKAMEANLRLAGNALEDSTIRAPFDGVIAKRNVQVGEKVSPDSPVFTVVDLSQMELDAPAPTAEIPAVKIGQTARFKVDGFGDREFTGTVWRINPVAEPGSRSIMVYLSVPNVDGALKGGMFAQGDLALDSGAAVVSIPLAAVRSESGVDYVWVVKDGTVQRRSVKFGLKSPAEGLVEVREGLQAGEQVIVAKVETLKDGTHVKLVESAAAVAPAPAAGN